MSNPTRESLLPELERAFSIQLTRIRQRLFPFQHSDGSRKPDLQEQEARLLGYDLDFQLEEDHDGR